MVERMIEYFTNIAFEPSMVLQNVISSVCLVILTYNFNRSWKSWLIAFVHSACLYAALTLTGILLSGWAMALPTRYVGNAVLTVVYALFFSKVKNKSKIITFTAFFAAENCWDEFMGTMPKLVEGFTHANALDIVLRTVCVVLTVVIALYMRKFSVDKLAYVPNASVYMVIAYSLMSVVVSVTYSFNHWQVNINGVYFASTTFVGLIAIHFLLYYLIYKQSGDYSNQIKTNNEKHKLERDMAMLQLAKINIDEIREIRHEVKNQYAYMELLLSDKKYEKAQEFFKVTSAKASKVLNFVYSDNDVVNTVVNLEIKKAQLCDIAVETQIIIPQTLPIDEGEISSLISNLLDNAIEACEKLPTEKTVKFNMQMRNNSLFITAENPICEGMDKRTLLKMESTKADKESHGYGSKIISKIAKKYNGYVKYSVTDDHKFVAEVMLLFDDSMAA